MRIQEQLQPEEKGKILIFTEADAKRVALERGRMLASIARYLSESEREAIQEKLEKENQLMLGMVETEEKFQTAPKRTPLVLNRIYFSRKTIDNNIFE